MKSWIKIADTKAKVEKLDKKTMYLLVNEGELSTFGPGGRFGDLIYDTLDLNLQMSMSKQVHMAKILIMSILQVKS